MEYNNLLELIKTVSDSNISGFQYEEGDTKIVITTGGNGLPGSMGVSVCTSENTVAQPVKVVETAETPVTVSQNIVVEAATAEKKQAADNIVKSPLVGTFYAAPAEDAEPFVHVGDAVKKGQTLGIVEAMKLMNDIEAEYEGSILEIFVENGDTVEYGQPLFSIG